MNVQTFVALSTKATASSATSNVPIIAACVTAGVALAVAALTIWVSRLTERDRRQHDVEMARASTDVKHTGERLDALRLAVAKYCATAIAEVDLATLAMREPTVQRRQELLEMHTDLRSQYEQMRLLTDSVEVQDAARSVLRVAWNERQEGLGLPRKTPRSTNETSASKYVRSHIHRLIREVRAELGLTGDLLDEPQD